MTWRNAHRAESVAVDPAVAAGTDVQSALQGLAVGGTLLTDLGLPDSLELAPTHEGDGSFQAVAADINIDAAAGTSGPGDTAFLAGVMGNALGTDLTHTANYVAGVVGALSVTGTKASEFQVGGVLGIVMDGVTEADGAVVAVIDGSDPSSVTRANAAFAARANTNNAGSGVDYGLDLYDPGRSEDAYTGGGEALAVAKAILRTPLQVCLLEGAGAPTSGAAGTGDNFASTGSIYIDVTAGNAYLQVGAITAPDWKLITREA